MIEDEYRLKWWEQVFATNVEPASLPYIRVGSSVLERLRIVESSWLMSTRELVKDLTEALEFYAAADNPFVADFIGEGRAWLADQEAANVGTR